MRRAKMTAAVLSVFAAVTLAGPAFVHAQEGPNGPAGPSDNRALSVIGLTSDGRLIRFITNRGSIGGQQTIGSVSGLVVDTSLVGIDFRVQDSNLYGVGNAGGIYTLSTGTAAATKVSQLTVALSGTNFGVDFNPAADRLRIISDAGQNLRHNVNAGGTTTTDGVLTYTAPPAAPVTATGVAGAAYTNNDLDPDTATTLYDVDSSLDQLAIQAPPNNGILNNVGKLVADTSAVIGLDIFTQLRNGTAVDDVALASLTVAGGSAMYQINLFTGQATRTGTFNQANQVVDIAIPLNQNPNSR